ncbi:DUF255 domain-containing protein [Salinibacterium sp. SYSU T00001]|uniref:thioredoxin domain-containing protein n=1 Tax=Homoserinimonas sedimenticola TaxID=2986805 RepID=UPI002235C02B|nr:DUF255 domain-containing protein [Salinibacterium sedimenticola]MCW4386379.1 DUF255 domain-containing protein [Salinibacterium sedimenticola]
MANRLANAVSPYLRGHADNPVDWWPWGDEPFAEARRRDVPVMVSIGYATCHWCHVMARESFSDPEIAAVLAERFVSVKVDREEHPDVDASHLAAASAFTQQLGWPLTVFVTPEGRAFYAGTYFPPRPVQGHPSFRQILDAVHDAWVNRRAEVEQNAAAVAQAIAASSAVEPGEIPTDLAPVVANLAQHEDAEFGGFGAAPKFPVAPVLNFLLSTPAGEELGRRTLELIAASPLRDPVEGGFFRYGTMRDWSDPHYERMLYDNAQLLDAYTRTGDLETASGIVGFLTSVMQLPSGGFASAQDSESVIDGQRSEGGYYRADAAARASLQPPALDEKVLAGWNGLTIGALAHAAFVFDRPEWADAACRAADHLLDFHVLGADSSSGRLVRASIEGRRSDAAATLEDYGMLAGGLLRLALTTGEARYASAGRRLLDATLGAGGFTVPGGVDPTLRAHGLDVAGDPSEGAYPSGVSACAHAALTLHELTGEARYREAAAAAASAVVGYAQANPVAFGASWELMARLAGAHEQLIVVTPSRPDASELTAAARRHPAALAAVVTEGEASALAEAGFALFEARTTIEGRATAYLCRDLVCRLPVTDAAALADA